MRQKPQTTSAGVRPAMEVYGPDWRFLGHVEDRGTAVSLLLAREKFGPDAGWVLPALVEV
jgi:hypothetical protein